MSAEREIRSQVESRQNEVKVAVDWHTPAGKRRSAPIYVAYVSNEYLGRDRELKAKSRGELTYKINECLGKWNEQEIKKRLAAAHKDAKEQAQAEAERLNQEAQGSIEELWGILKATLSIDDRIDWDAERDTRTYPPFTYGPPPTAPAPRELVLPPEPGWTWLFRGRRKRWEADCTAAEEAHAADEANRRKSWQASVDEHKAFRDAAHRRHEETRSSFLAEQEEFNTALAGFKRRFEANDADAITEYCSRVLERSSYPESIQIKHDLEFDSDSGTLLVNLELPSMDQIPSVAGYKFTNRGNKIEPVSMKQKELSTLHASILDQTMIRTMHEIFEGCYTNSVTRVIVNGWVTTLNTGTGLHERAQVRCIASDREAFESMNLSLVEPGACIANLSNGVGGMSEGSR